MHNEHELTHKFDSLILFNSSFISPLHMKCFHKTYCAFRTFETKLQKNLEILIFMSTFIMNSVFLINILKKFVPLVIWSTKRSVNWNYILRFLGCFKILDNTMIFWLSICTCIFGCLAVWHLNFIAVRKKRERKIVYLKKKKECFWALQVNP